MTKSEKEALKIYLSAGIDRSGRMSTLSKCIVDSLTADDGNMQKSSYQETIFQSDYCLTAAPDELYRAAGIYKSYLQRVEKNR